MARYQHKPEFMKTLSYHVYCTAYPTTAGYEGSRATLHNARRLAAALRRQGFAASIQAIRELDGAQWCEVVS